MLPIDQIVVLAVHATPIAINPKVVNHRDAFT